MTLFIHNVIFSAEGGPIWIKFRRLVQKDMSSAVIWAKSKPDVEFQYGGRLGENQWHVIPEPSATFQDAVTWQIQCHDPRATCYIAGCCHRANLMACHRRATYHIAECCHLVNSLSWFQSYMPHCRVQSPRNQCHDRATLQGVRIPCTILKFFLPYFIYFLF